MIKKENNKFVVYDSSGTKKLGEHPTHKQAVKQLQAIEVSKAAEHIIANRKKK